MITLRPYQAALRDAVYDAWRTYRNVGAVLPTGGGKTVIFSDIIRDSRAYSMAIAHRQELVGQISCSLAHSGIEHNIIAPDKIIRWICGLQYRKYGKHYHNPNAKTYVAGVRTLNSRAGTFPDLCKAIELWVLDECHHLLSGNEWGKAVERFPRAKGLGVTATPLRADGKGLGRAYDGVLDTIVSGPNMRDLISEGHLSDYKVYSIPTHIDMTGVNVTARGDWNKKKLKTAARKSRIVGDVVEHYLRIAPGKLGVTFVTDVETARDVAMQFRHQGVPAEAVSAKTPDHKRQEAVAKLGRGELKQLVNVDLFGEGFDLPAIEVISMARPTESYGMYCQQFGRVLRTADGKVIAIIIDHVGNVMRHGLPDYGRAWTLKPRDRKSSNVDPNLLPVKTCVNCTAVYSGYSLKCPYCGYVSLPAARSTPELVEGDLTLLDEAAMEALRGERDRIDCPPEDVASRMLHAGAPQIAALGAAKRHKERSFAQTVLRDAISIWAGYRRARKIPDSQTYKEFYHKFGVDVGTAQCLGRPDAEQLTDRIVKEMIS